MGWDQGINVREDLPARFVEWADAKKGARLEYITWFGNDPPVYLDFGEAGSLEVALPINRFVALVRRLGANPPSTPAAL